ncbi:unnamed protein product, partial [Urochloa humidicola]
PHRCHPIPYPCAANIAIAIISPHAAPLPLFPSSSNSQPPHPTPPTRSRRIPQLHPPDMGRDPAATDLHPTQRPEQRYGSGAGWRCDLPTKDAFVDLAAVQASTSPSLVSWCMGRSSSICLG